MCGRTCCTLNKDVVPLACSTVTPQVPKWQEAPCGGHYEASTNVPPTAYTPVLFQGCDKKISARIGNILCSYFFEYSRIYFLSGAAEELCVQPMLWGLIPFWHKSMNPTDHKLTTNNARIEGLTESKMYKPLLEKDQR